MIISNKAIKQFVSDQKIFIDTCSLLSKGFTPFSNYFFSILQDASQHIIIPLRVIEELQKFEKDKNHKCHQTSISVLKTLAKLQSLQLIEIKGENSDNFADNVFLCQFSKFRLLYNLVLITQDTNLTRDILNLNNVKSQKGKLITVFRLLDDGRLDSITI